MKQKVIVILGPTATGKTALAVELARTFGGEVVSADSRQIYRGLDLGTGKVTKREMRGVPHYLLDVASPKRQFSAAQFAEQARASIADIAARGKVPIVCGGTGFYIDTLLGLSIPDVPPDPKLRKKLAAKSVAALLTELKRLDPERAQTIDQNNPVRLVRAIEIAKALGKVPPRSSGDETYDTLKIGLDMPDETLKERIAKRLDERQKKGMLREAERLHTGGLSWKRMRELGLEYRTMADYLTGTHADLAAFKERLTFDIWHYAKRQRRWFKRDTNIHWLNPLKKSDLKRAQTLASRFLKH